MSSPTSPTSPSPEAREQLLFHHPRHVLCARLCKEVLLGVGDARDALSYSLQTLTGSTPHQTSASLAKFFSLLNPHLVSNLRLLSEYARRTLFTLPPSLHLSVLQRSVDTALTARSLTPLRELDVEIASLRAQIRAADLQIALCRATTASAARQMRVLTAVSGVEPRPDARIGPELARLQASIEAAERQFGDAAAVLNAHRPCGAQRTPLVSAAAVALAAPVAPRVIPPLIASTINMPAAVGEEHEPINHFMPSAMSILNVAVEHDRQKLAHLATLRARLLG